MKYDKPIIMLAHDPNAIHANIEKIKFEKTNDALLIKIVFKEPIPQEILNVVSPTLAYKPVTQ